MPGMTLHRWTAEPFDDDDPDDPWAPPLPDSCQIDVTLHPDHGTIELGAYGDLTGHDHPAPHLSPAEARTVASALLSAALILEAS